MKRMLRRAFTGLLLIGGVAALLLVAAMFVVPGRLLDAEIARREWMAGGDVVVLLHGLQADAGT